MSIDTPRKAEKSLTLLGGTPYKGAAIKWK